jgi:hypothetical protein
MTGQLQTTNCAYYVGVILQSVSSQLIVSSLAITLAVASATIGLRVSGQISTPLVVACTQCSGHLNTSESGSFPEGRYRVTSLTIAPTRTLPLGVYHKLICKVLAWLMTTSNLTRSSSTMRFVANMQGLLVYGTQPQTLALLPPASRHAQHMLREFQVLSKHRESSNVNIMDQANMNSATGR